MKQCVEKTYKSIHLGFRTTTMDGMLEEHCFILATRKFKQSLALGHLWVKNTLILELLKFFFPTHM